VTEARRVEDGAHPSGVAARFRQRLRLRLVRTASHAPLALQPTALMARMAVHVGAIQHRAELTRFLAIVRLQRPRVVVEIGTARGGTLYGLACVAARDALLVSIDLPGGKFGGGYDDVTRRRMERYARRRQTLRFLPLDSHSASTRNRLIELLDGRPVDLLYIDGDHTYEGVRADFAGYTPLVAPEGRVAFHDIVSGDAERSGGVPRFWSELKAQMHEEPLEFVDDWNQNGLGIGVLRGAEARRLSVALSPRGA
jgi:cephalosporin hydroxylase